MKAVTVTQVNEYIAKKLRDDYNLRRLPVEGEISSISRSGSHIYLTLKDAGSILKCAIWASNIPKIDPSYIENGRKVIAVGDISPYAKGGSYSFSITHMEDAGEGDLMAEFNALCGLDDEGNKKTFAAVASFGELRMWFLSNYTELNEGRSQIDKILENIKTAKAAA